MKIAKWQKYLLPGLMFFFCAVFLVSAGFLIKYALNSTKQTEQNDELANLVDQIQQDLNNDYRPIPTLPQAPQQPENPDNPDDPQAPTGDSTANPTIPYSEPESAYTEITHPSTGETMKVLKEYAPVFERNTDMVGWIKIPGTKIHYPVVQTPNSPNYYLKRDFYKKSSSHGTIYASELADIKTPSDNVTLFGHNMNDGSMFAALHGYNTKDFFEKNPYIIFDTLYEHHTYQIFAVFYTTDIVGQGFAYHAFVDGNTISFAEFVSICKDLSLYDTGVTATYGDKLLTLSTCDKNYWDDHGRFVVVAKRIS